MTVWVANIIGNLHACTKCASACVILDLSTNTYVLLPQPPILLVVSATNHKITPWPLVKCPLYDKGNHPRIQTWASDTGRYRNQLLPRSPPQPGIIKLSPTCTKSPCSVPSPPLPDYHLLIWLSFFVALVQHRLASTVLFTIALDR